MRYIYNDLGQRRRGDIVEFTLRGIQANIALMDSSNYSAFRNGRKWRGVNRLAIGSPVRLGVPSSGHWYGVIYIPPGYTGRVNGSIGVLPSLPPTIRPASQSPLGAIRDAAEEYSESFADLDLPDKDYDVFICHAGRRRLSPSLMVSSS